jgi:F-type H+-transporting ATPase subunit b
MQEFQNIIKELGIEPSALLINTISFILLVWLMKRFMFKPVGLFIEQRRQRIHEQLDAADSDRAGAAAERAEIAARREELLAAAQDEAQDVKQAATQDAEQTRKTARDQARDIEKLARAQTVKEAEEASQQLREEANETAAAMARRLLQATLTDERHRALMDQFIADVEKMAGEQGS